LDEPIAALVDPLSVTGGNLGLQPERTGDQLVPDGKNVVGARTTKRTALARTATPEPGRVLVGSEPLDKADPLEQRRSDCEEAPVFEVITLPVADIDRAVRFYVDQVGFTLDVDYAPIDGFRVVQLTPRGSSCSIQIGHGLTEAPGRFVTRISSSLISRPHDDVVLDL
jgi:hypothetical protein